MKKTIYLLILFIMLSISVNAKNYVLENNNIKVGINILEKNATINTIIDKTTNTSFITEESDSNSLWTLIVKKDGDYDGEEIKLNPTDAISCKVDNKKTSLKITWNNVKNDTMASGFNVIVTINLKDNNSYWNINVSENKEYGIWQVIFPNITNIDAAKGNRVIIPNYGGLFEDNYNQNQDIQYPGVNCTNQFTTVTKGESTLYLSPEDPFAGHKIFSFHTQSPGNMNFYITENPNYMAEAGHEYKQAYNFNIAVIKGDWFDGAKKFRKWGVDSKFIPFSQGRFADRTNLPEWFKDLPIWISLHGLTEEHKANIIATQKYLDLPVACHVYHWSQYTFDTHYPNWLPAIEVFKDYIKELQANNIMVMPYTNTHLVDINQAPTYKKYGDILLSFGPNQKPRVSEFQAEGANNVSCCPTSPYYDAYVEEVCNIMKEENIDALYMDQVGCVPAFTCFNKEHNHPVGGGDHWTATYNKMINEIREKLSQIKGENIVITTESSAEAYPFDAWLRCNESAPFLADSPINSIVYSGYVANFGNYYYGEEFTRQDSLPAINKFAVELSKGYQPGWSIGTGNELNAYPNFGKYVKGVAQGRYAAKEYFNLGEMVRNVKITSPVPKEKIFWQNFAIQEEAEFPVVRTCSFNYKGKTMVCLTNIQINNSIKVDFEAQPKDLYLSEKDSYKISEIFPNKVEISNSKNIKASTELQPLETKIFIVE